MDFRSKWTRTAFGVASATFFLSTISLQLQNAFAAEPAAPTSPAAPTAREQHAAECVAALEVDAEGLAARVKAGDEAARPQLQSRVEAGTAFVGDVYLHGSTDESRARALANQALETQKSLAPAQLAARQSACAEEGTKLLASSNGLERAIVQNFARKRMAKLLAG